REVFEDGSMGEIYFIRYLDYSGWTEDRLPFPYYKSAKDESFIKICDELLADKLVTQQWAEEHGNMDELIGFKLPGRNDKSGVAPNSPFEAASSFCWYHIDSDTIIGLWKQGRVSRSDNGGKDWTIVTEPTFVTSGAKSWGQKTEDGKYLIAYVNSLSSEHRYPLVAVVSGDGVKFDDMACVCGEVPPRRYEGIYKDFGPQYIRGISEGHKEYPAGAVWLCHSMNKEDIFVSRVPVPFKKAVTGPVNDTFENCGTYIKDWNIYSGKWANVSPFKMFGTDACMRLADKDPLDYARAMRIFEKSKKTNVSLELMAAGQYEENLEIEVTDGTGVPACRVYYGGGWLKIRYASNIETAFLLPAEPRWHELEIEIDCVKNTYAVSLNGMEFDYGGTYRFINKVNDVERLIIRTKPRRYFPNFDENYPDTPDMAGADEPKSERVYYIRNVNIK
ncbi:MAG: hypothetical protein FWF08_07940, partial [Oscillospiraceae bacterium]|nr:hypothetical protein [Oscillospiraceae bacterium]